MVENFRRNRPAFDIRDLAPVSGRWQSCVCCAGAAVLADADDHSAGARIRPLLGLPLLPRGCQPAVFHAGADDHRHLRRVHPHPVADLFQAGAVRHRDRGPARRIRRSAARALHRAGFFEGACPASTSAAILSSACRRCSGCWNRRSSPACVTRDIYLHPLARAAWVGIFSTALNLLPIGQLDGGHILYSLVGERHKLLSRIFVVGWCRWACFRYPGWSWALVLLDHRTAAPRDLRYHRTGSGPKAPGLAGPGDLLLCFMPTPIGSPAS